MKIVTWNINSIRLRMQLLKSFCEEHQPDVIAIQETKASDLVFPLGDCISLGYPYVRFSGEKSYNGVTILSKYPVEEEFCLSFYNEDKRHIAVKIADVEIHNFYVPAGGDEPDQNVNPKFRHKLSYLDSMNDWFLKNRHKDQNIVLVGDLNIAPLEHDVWSSKALRNVVSHTNVEREKLNRNMNEFGFIDAPRLVFPETEKLYSWWSYRNLDWEKSDRGRRLDHIWITPNLAKKPISSYIVKNMRKSEGPSDHVPVIVSIA